MTNVSPERHKSRELQLAVARLMQKQSGISPREAGVVYETQTLDWIYRWGFSTSKIIQSLLRRTSGGYLNRLSRKGLLTKTETSSGQINHFYTLKEDGLSQIEAIADKLLKYIEIKPNRVKQNQIKHYLICQKLTLAAMQNGEITQFQTEREFQDQGLIKQPDCIWRIGEELVGIEVELSPKWGRVLDQFILKILDTLENLDKNPHGLHKFRIYVNSEASFLRYTRVFTSGYSYAVWKKNTNGKWECVRREIIPRWSSSLISVRYINPPVKN